jgi:hypothetical protein
MLEARHVATRMASAHEIDKTFARNIIGVVAASDTALRNQFILRQTFQLDELCLNICITLIKRSFKGLFSQWCNQSILRYSWRFSPRCSSKTPAFIDQGLIEFHFTLDTSRQLPS